MQVVLLRWWMAKENYASYEDFARKYEVNPYEPKQLKWSDVLEATLKAKLRDIDFVEIERLNKHYADYQIRKIMFEKYLPYLQDGAIFIGHSLWGSFALKYFAQNPQLLDKFKKIILVAPAVEDTKEELLWSFKPSFEELTRLKNFQHKLVVFASKDDPIVPYQGIQKLQKVLPQAKYYIFENKGHFWDLEFPELVKELMNTW